MLGSLARKLRLFGYDAHYTRSLGDEELVALAQREGRILVTRDAELQRKAARQGVRALLLQGEGEEAQLAELAQKLGLRLQPPSPARARCSKCNGQLERVGRDVVAQQVPPRVLEGREVFYRCRECGQVYWYGGHWARIERFSWRVLRLLEGDGPPPHGAGG
jgi:hypothetical protein